MQLLTVRPHLYMNAAAPLYEFSGLTELETQAEFMREYTAQIPFPESVPHPHLTWRQEEENHGVSKS